VQNLKEIVIPKENAVFWMDGNGRWHNVHGPFRHKKLIDYFNTSIGRDSDGFFVSQERGEVHEKVYFRYEETALFGVAVSAESDLMVILNTQERIKLRPEKLFIKNDCLFMHYQDTLIKFTDRCMMWLAEYIEENEGIYYFEFKDKKVMIATMDKHSRT
jgi:hypothetical protein